MSDAIRVVRENDAEAIQRIYAPYCTSTAVSFETHPPTLAEIRDRIGRIARQHPYLVFESDGVVAGYVYAGPHRERASYTWSVDVAVYIDELFHGRGIGSGLYTAIFRLLLVQGYFNAFAGITLPNPASVGLHEAFGFVPVGVYRSVGYKLGSWHDVGWWRLELQPPRLDPPLPRPIGMLDNPDVSGAFAAGLARLHR